MNGFMFSIGLILGSFVCFLIEAIPQKRLGEIRSRCRDCSHGLSLNDLVPLFSYLRLYGRCRYCQSKIPTRYIVIELLCGVLFVFSYKIIGLCPELFFYQTLVLLLIVIAYIDIDTYLIFDRFHIIVILLGIIRITINNFPISCHLIGSMVVSIPYGICALISGGIGGGDVKLMASLGFYLGPVGIVLTFIISVVLSVTYSLIGLMSGKLHRKDMLPFAPFICIGAGVTLFYETEIIRMMLTTL